MTQLRWATVLLLACSAGKAQAANGDFDATFGQCAEYVGIGLIPKARARPLVPIAYTLAGDETNAVIVVRVTNCAAVTVNGGNSKAAHTAQIGIMLSGLTGADIDNYLLWYVTDHGQLHGACRAAGLKCGNDQQLSFSFTPSNVPSALAIGVAAAQLPEYGLQGQAAVPTASAVSFVANWWADGSKGTMRMHSVFPAIHFGTASVTLTTPAGSELATLIGAQTMQFVLLDSYNEFAAAVMDVRQQ